MKRAFFYILGVSLFIPVRLLVADVGPIEGFQCRHGACPMDADPGFWRGGESSMGAAMNWGFFGLGWLFSLIVWILIVLSIVAIVNYFIIDSDKRDVPGTKEEPLDILRQRYARGEITKQQFQEMKKDLTDDAKS